MRARQCRRDNLVLPSLGIRSCALVCAASSWRLRSDLRRFVPLAARGLLPVALFSSAATCRSTLVILCALAPSGCGWVGLRLLDLDAGAPASDAALDGPA